MTIVPHKIRYNVQSIPPVLKPRTAPYSYLVAASVYKFAEQVTCLSSTFEVMSRRTPITQRAFQGIAAGIGLVSESITAHKAKKQSQASGPSLEDSATRETASEGGESPVYELATEENGIQETPETRLEEQWALDEIQEELQLEEETTSPPKYTEMAEPVSEVTLATQFTNSHPPPPYIGDENMSQARLSAPVVLPQRRPKNRDRGFIRAYAPALGECGIDQETFIDFLDTAEKACRATPWLRAINLASIGTMWLPSVTGIAVSIAIQIATDAAIAVDGRRKYVSNQKSPNLFLTN